jgi:hypothetical protein
VLIELGEIALQVLLADVVLSVENGWMGGHQGTLSPIEGAPGAFAALAASAAS